MWSQITNVTDGQTYRQTDRRHAMARPRFALCIVHRAVKMGWRCMWHVGVQHAHDSALCNLTVLIVYNVHVRVYSALYRFNHLWLRFNKSYSVAWSPSPGGIVMRCVCWLVRSFVRQHKLCSGRISPKRLGIYRLGYNGAPIGSGIWRIEWSRVQWRHVTRCGRRLRSPTALLGRPYVVTGGLI